MSSCHGDTTVSATYGDMDQNTRDVIMGILLTESSTSSRMLITTEAPALALCKVPQCNSLWTDEYIRQYHSVNVAVQTEHGLFDADKKGLSKIADEVKSFKQKAKENSLKPEDYEALSLCQILEELMGSSNSAPSSIPHNLEYLPSDQVIKVEKRVVPGAGPDQYTFASYMSVTLSCDHRVIDGA
ncbi:hypothetical protein Sjap_017930 [Stephania japonica]|uniref:2-oxoacid dehydrogenase acyltransferase catalytic domain-containing protein n=1 Tax=Stephania japonica TaxID=461633 RepID=A0AAP0NL09_9MAGN